MWNTSRSPTIEELARHEFILGQDGGHPWETGITGVGRNRQNGQGGKLHQVIGRPDAEQPASQGRQNGFVGTSHDPKELGQADAAGKEKSHQHRHDDQCLAGIHPFGRFEGRHPIADGFDAGECCAAGRESVHDQEQ